MSILGVYNPVNIELDHGDGVYLYSKDGTRYLDFTSGIGVTCLGHSHPSLVNALKDQSEKLWHCSNLFKINGQEMVAKRIVKNSFASSVFFCNSGTESIEAGIKVVRKYFNSKDSKKYKIICAKNSFHGRTYAAISTSGKSKLTDGYFPILKGFEQVEFNNIKDLKKKIDNETAAIMIETIQGEGGIIPAKKQYLKDVQKIAKDYGLLLYFDEVQCGVGRTGKFLATEWVEELRPNLVSIAKGIGGGFPLGALLLDSKTSKVMKHGAHGSTFGGNPLSMAIANEVLNFVLDADFLDNIREVGYNMRQLIKSEIIERFPKLLSGIRGVGLMIGIECIQKNETLINAMIKKKLLTVRAGQNVIRILPPLILEMKHVDEAINKMTKAFESL
ncbi:MAG: acetylornithine transaminase [Rickettsiales bacterium]|nr:acetylornithine transaminase [Rickettsiales bacterium]|tara:strand:- start:391 stop:1554 length:1164 start_codon:yes stop_codon:yes gene_type:complete